MPQEPDVPLLVEETGVFLAIGGAILDGIADVALDDDGSVYGDTGCCRPSQTISSEFHSPAGRIAVL